MSALLDTLARWKNFNAVVVGDFMLDETIYGDADRLSPDAPVPVLHVRKIDRRPGGAANLALALAALGGEVTAIGALGKDESGRELGESLTKSQVRHQFITDASRPTTVKRYHVGLAQHRHPQKMFRVDFEARHGLDVDAEQRLISAYDDALGNADAVFIEDYAKGVCTPAVCHGVIDRATRAGVPVFVDPASISDFARYRGCTAITPNRTEAEKATGLACNESGPEGSVELATRLLDQLDCEAVVLTLDRHGALLLERGCEAVVVPTVARDVYDVTGAGDVFVAALGAGRANGCDWADAVRMANAAAGLEVEHFGATPIPLERVHQQLLAASSTGKLRSLDELLIEVRAWRRDNKRIVFTNGCFDVIHAGHVSLLDRARSLGDVLIVATNTDERISEYKGAGRPVNPLSNRAMVLSGLRAVDAVAVFEEETPIAMLEEIRPDVLVKGDEYPISEIPGASFVLSYGGSVERLPMLAGYSSTEVLRKLGDHRADVTTTQVERDRFIKDRPDG